ncbi:MAG TPA: ester cyclase, partial [Polyangiaceae bacterium]|nr:ester cyclase [Polyangiaceae bacterium]
TNTGPIMTPGGEMPATHKKFGFLAGHAADTTEDGRAVAHDRLYVDGGTFMGQLGISKGPHRKVLEKAAAEKQVVVATGSDVEKANLAASPKMLEAFNKHDLPTLVGMMTDDVVFSEAASPMDQIGKKAVEKSYKEMFKAFSDVKLEIARSWVAGDYVVSEGSLVGTNDGPMPSAKIYKPTGKKVSSRFLEIDKVQGGKLKNIWVFDNGMAFAMQLGMMPPPGAAKPAAPAAKAGPAPAGKPGAAPTTAPGGQPAAAGAAPAAMKPGPAAAGTAAPAAPTGKPPAPASPTPATPTAKPVLPAPVTPAPAKPQAPAPTAKPVTPAPVTPAPAPK